MPPLDAIPEGTFCWVEVATPDQAAAKRFYGTLLGWTADDIPTAPNETYTLFKVEGRPAAGAYTLNREMVAAHVPPHWGLHISVAEVEAAAGRVAGLGGTLLKGVCDVSDAGRMAVVRDSVGAVFMLWQAKRHQGFCATGANTFCWADLMTADAAAAQAFYGGLLGWVFTSAPNDSSGTLHIRNGESFIGGIPPRGSLPPQMPPHWQIWFDVADVDAAIATATGMGATLLMPAQKMAGVGRLAMLRDPQGAAFGIITPARTQARITA